MQNIPLGIKIPINKILSILLILLFATFSFKCVTMAFTSAISFDGAMNAQVPLNLIKNFKYATSFDTIKEFDQIIQTGIPVLLPVAIFFKLFGVSC